MAGVDFINTFRLYSKSVLVECIFFLNIEMSK